MRFFLTFLLGALLLIASSTECRQSADKSSLKRYTPDWNSLDSRPLPDWYDKAKFGIFIHWGVFAVPGFASEWFWWQWQGSTPNPDVVNFMKNNYPPGFTYADFGNQFTGEFFNPDEWTDIFNASGAKYIVLTSKHHEGFCLWPSANSFNWNAQDIGPHRDLVGDLANSIRKNSNIKFGLYHSLFEWFNPLYLSDKASGYTKQDFVNFKTMPELYDIVNRYQPELVWSDGDWEAPDTYWNSTSFLAWLFNDSPVKDTVVTNDRWGAGDICHHGSYYTCTDNYNPGVLLSHKWENCMTLDKNSWGYRRNLNLGDVNTIEYVIESLVTTVSCGGNLLLNVGPTKEGHIPPIFEERLRQMGQWLQVNGEAIYETIAWKHQNDTTNPDVWYTTKPGNNPVYAILLKYPAQTQQVKLTAPVPSQTTSISLLGYNGTLDWTAGTQAIYIDLSKVNLPADLKWSWVFKLTDIN